MIGNSSDSDGPEGHSQSEKVAAAAGAAATVGSAVASIAVAAGMTAIPAIGIALAASAVITKLVATYLRKKRDKG